MEQIRLDIIPKGIMPVCHTSQYDVGRVIRLNIVDGLQGYIFTDEAAVLNVRKPDNTVVTAAVPVAAGSSYLDITTTQQMVAVAGENICEVKITKSSTIIGTINFKMKVERDVLDGGSESESEIHDLRTQVAEDVAIEVSSQYDSNSVIFDEEATAGHNTGYVVSSEYIKELEAEIDEKANSADLATVATSGNYNDLSNKPVIDSSLSSSSTNAVQNKIVKSAIDAKANTSDLADVATSGDYNDLDNRPNLSSVAISGNYGDLLNKPMTEQGTVNNINFSGLAQGMYRCYVPTNSTGTPASNVGGHCLTFINDSVNYGSQILFSNLGLFWRNRASGSWGNWHTLEEPDLHYLTAGTSITIEKGGYVKQGRIVTVCVTIKANANRSVGDIVLTGLPTPLNNNDALTGAQMAGSTGTFAFRINSTNLYPNQALTSGQSYVINGSYLANSY